MAALLLAVGATALTSSAGFATALGLSAGSLGLSVASSAVIGLAGMAGGIIDQALFGPKAPDQQGPRLQSLGVSTATEGTPLREITGTMRVPAEIMWALSKREVASTQSGGKGMMLGGGGSVTTYSYLGSFAAALCLGPIDRIGRAWANGEIVDLGEYSHRLYLGTSDQLPDALIEAAEGAAPAFRHTAYLVFEEMPLDRFGQALPKLDIEVTRATPSPGLRGIVERLAADRGIAVDATGVSTDGDVTGYLVDRPMSLAAALDPLARLFRLDVSEADGVITVRSRSTASIAEIVEEAMVAGRDGQGAVTVERGAARDLAAKTTLAWIDPGRDYAPATSSFRRGVGSGKRETVLEAPMALDDATARRLVTGLAAAAGDGRTAYRWATGPSQIARTPGDVVTLTEGGRSSLAQIGRATWGTEIRFEGHGVSARPDLARGRAGRAALSAVDPTPDAPVVHFLDMAMLTDDEANPHRPWVAADATVWRGVAVQRDEGAGFAQILDVAQHAQIGALTAALAAGPDDGTLDVTSVVEVTMRRGAFASVAAASLDDAPLNAIAVRNAAGEWEILQFATATLITGNSWELTDLKRGRRGTEHAMGAALGAPLVVLDDAVVKLPILPEQIGTAYTYRYGPSPLPNDDPAWAETALTFRGKGLRPWTPIPLSAVEGGGGDITIGWTPRARITTDPGTVPQRYDVRVYDGATVLRSWLGQTGTSVLYAAADAEADNGGTAPTDLDIGVTPNTDAFGDGVEARATITL